MTELQTWSVETPANSPGEVPDGALLQGWAAEGRSGDFTELVRRYLGLVRGIAGRQLGEDDADDLAQAVFAILARKAASLKGLRSLSAWLHRVTMLQCRNAVRRIVRERRSRQAAMENAVLSAARDPLAEALPHLDSAINALRESDRELILMRYSEGLSFAEASGRTGRSEAALRQQAGRAVESLGTHLRRSGVTVPATALIAGLGTALSGTDSAEAAALCGRAALAAAKNLSAGTLAAVTISTMNTIQSIAAGGAAALLLAAGPVVWRMQQISKEQGAEGVRAQSEPASPFKHTAALPREEAPVPPPAAVSVSSSAVAAPSAPGNIIEELGNLAKDEMMASFSEWSRRNAWLEARRTGRLLALSPEREEKVRRFVEAQLMERVRKTAGEMAGGADGDDKHRDRVEYEAKLQAWYAANLTPEENAVRDHAARGRREALVERLAEDALHNVSSAMVLNEEQKTRLYDAAAAKVTRQLADNDYSGSASFGASIEPAKAEPLEVTAADAIAAVLEPAQLELWEQSREQERLFTDVFPRRMADRVLNAIRERGTGGVVADLLRGALGGE